MSLEIIILAAGRGTRMFSSHPKVLHELSGKPMLQYVLDTAESIKPDQIHVVYGHGGLRVMERFSKHNLNWVEQSEQKGTGHAVQQAISQIDENAIVLVLYGDVPLIDGYTIASLLKKAAQNKLAILTISLDEPGALGRIIRDQHNKIIAITEYKDASGSEREIKEINTGVIAVNARKLKCWLSRLSNNNAQNEYYLTDIVKMAAHDKVPIESCEVKNEIEIMGINSKSELAELEKKHQKNLALNFMEQGLTIIDPARIDIRGQLHFGKDCIFDVNTIIEGDCRLGENVRIGAHCIIKNSHIGDDTVIEPYSLIENSIIGVNCQVGPYARLRPGTKLHKGVKIGNFVEVKNSVIGPNSKANHLSYVGDTQVGASVNMGAGMITCNYDGANKHKTIIGDNVHIGSDCQLVAPVTINKNATIGAGTTVYKDAPQGELSVNKKEQITLPGWQRPLKKPG